MRVTVPWNAVLLPIHGYEFRVRHVLRCMHGNDQSELDGVQTRTAALCHMDSTRDWKHLVQLPHETDEKSLFRHPMTHTTSACCREAIRKLKIPQLLKDEFLEACIKSHIPVPLVREDWESLQREIGAAFVAMISIICFQDTTRADQEFGQTASILFRDRSKRAYAFSATADSSRAPAPKHSQTLLCLHPP